MFRHSSLLVSFRKLGSTCWRKSPILTQALSTMTLVIHRGTNFFFLYEFYLLESFFFFFGYYYKWFVHSVRRAACRMYPAKTITDADYADDIVLLANTPNQAETLLHNLERATAGIGLHVNAHKTEYMCYNQGDLHLHTRRKPSDTSRQIHQLRKQRLINEKRHRRHGQISVGFRSYGNQTWPINWNAVSSRLRSYRYCYIDELRGR